VTLDGTLGCAPTTHAASFLPALILLCVFLLPVCLRKGGLGFVIIEDFGSRESTSVRISDNELVDELTDSGILLKLKMGIENTITKV
jgi:hypothetical protein